MTLAQPWPVGQGSRSSRAGSGLKRTPLPLSEDRAILESARGERGDGISGCVIWMEMNGRLGNQIFQYVSARSIAERQRLPFVYSRHRHELEEAFELPGSSFNQPLLRMASVPLRRSGLFKTRTPAKRMMVPGFDFEVFDESLFSCGAWTRLVGYLETPEYFVGPEERVRGWFRFRSRHVTRVQEIETGIAAPPEERCCLHIRRTDLLKIRRATAHPQHGLALPLEYYVAALEHVPADAAIVVIGDEPEYVRPLLAGRERVYYSQGESPAVDMALVGRCRWNIISNSTFSWWSAWLNARADRVVIGPRYFRGWYVNQWDMPGLAVAGWDWLDWR